mmetsp:Transcript_59729/g.185338  ORF Transcript_59729/g.185338 Transcript_59729/m.185338 type:complete len:208 (-) Transcript_59729:7-630(-)
MRGAADRCSWKRPRSCASCCALACSCNFSSSFCFTSNNLLNASFASRFSPSAASLAVLPLPRLATALAAAAVWPRAEPARAPGTSASAAATAGAASAAPAATAARCAPAPLLPATAAPPALGGRARSARASLPDPEPAEQSTTSLPGGAPPGPAAAQGGTPGRLFTAVRIGRASPAPIKADISVRQGRERVAPKGGRLYARGAAATA